MKLVEPEDLTPSERDALIQGLDQLIEPDTPRPDQEVAA